MQKPHPDLGAFEVGGREGVYVYRGAEKGWVFMVDRLDCLKS